MSSIVTKRLLLVPCNGTVKSDVKKIVEWLNDPELMRFSEQRHRTHTVQTQWVYMDGILPPSRYLLIVQGTNLIGTATAFVDRHNHVADLGIMIGSKDHRGQGFGTEAWDGLMQNLFLHGIRKVEAGCMSRNTGMIRIFEKNSMFREGSRELHYDLGNNDFCDMELYARFRE